MNASSSSSALPTMSSGGIATAPAGPRTMTKRALGAAASARMLASQTATGLTAYTGGFAVGRIAGLPRIATADSSAPEALLAGVMVRRT